MRFLLRGGHRFPAAAGGSSGGRAVGGLSGTRNAPVSALQRLNGAVQTIAFGD
ncbi:MAG TPA: hypothetical protein VMB85_10850 [Bryobacteraceae bacterium]|nr:hypothetical protein [Bryobacteraceae bacterium]